MKIRSYKDLSVWQKSMDLVEECYRLTDGFPRNEEFGLKSQSAGQLYQSHRTSPKGVFDIRQTNTAVFLRSPSVPPPSSRRKLNSVGD